jgi:hypothetical protein
MRRAVSPWSLELTFPHERRSVARLKYEKAKLLDALEW